MFACSWYARCSMKWGGSGRCDGTSHSSIPRTQYDPAGAGDNYSAGRNQPTRVPSFRLISRSSSRRHQSLEPERQRERESHEMLLGPILWAAGVHLGLNWIARYLKRISTARWIGRWFCFHFSYGSSPATGASSASSISLKLTALPSYKRPQYLLK